MCNIVAGLQRCIDGIHREILFCAGGSCGGHCSVTGKESASFFSFFLILFFPSSSSYCLQVSATEVISGYT